MAPSIFKTIRSIMPEKISLWLAVYLIGLVSFALFRALFLLFHFSLIDTARAADIAEAFIIGARYDTVTLCIMILPFFLITIWPRIKMESNSFRRFFLLTVTIIFCLFFFALTADIKYFDNFGSRLNFWAIEYADSPAMYFYSIFNITGFWYLIAAWPGATAILYIILRKIYRSLIADKQHAGPGRLVISYLLFLALLIIGIRGSFGAKPLDWGTAIFGHNQVLNQSALNGIYTLTHSILEASAEGEADYAGDLTPENISAARTDVIKMLDITPVDSTSLAHKTVSRHQIGFRPNVVVVIMESWSGEWIGALGSKLGVTPHFDSLAAHGILFTNFYANGVRTNRGIPAVLCSFPSLSGRAIMKRYAASLPFRSLAQVLGDYDYHSIFAYGGDINFDNMEGFLRASGYQQFFSESDFPGAPELGKWGLADDAVFKQLSQRMNSFPRPFQLGVMTISNHDPYMIPDDRFKIYPGSDPESRQYNVLYYTDWALGQFIAETRQLPLFDSTVFVFVADHCAHQYPKYPLAPDNFHIPLLIYAPGILGDSGVIVSKTGSQVDIIPTVVDLLGLSPTLYSWGRDLLSLPSDDPGFAVIVGEDRLGLIEPPYFFFDWVKIGKYMYDMRATDYLEHDILRDHSDTAAIMERRLASYIRLAEYLSRGRSK
ncbi:putative Sulfatase [Candidatus Zixiibacteriota bacterium]|nr:putative Sulfatase [candidate division Zixibacteria bacterium]